VVCSRAAYKSVTYRSRRSVHLAAQVPLAGKITIEMKLRAARPVPVMDGRGERVVLSRTTSDTSTTWSNRSDQVGSHFPGQIEQNTAIA